MTLQQLRIEYDHRKTERLGHLCEDRQPSHDQETTAEQEAQRVIEELNRQSRKEKGYT